MKTTTKIAIAVPGVGLGVTVFIYLCCAGVQFFHIANLRQLLSFMPVWIQLWVGVMNVAVFLPIFLLGILKLTPRGAVGESPDLITGGVYRYLRNPMYAGVSFTIIGLGVILGHTGVVLAGLGWLLLCYFQSKREERELTARFNDAYTAYRRQTPRFVPEFQMLLGDLWRTARQSL